ncbi:MAG: uracil-DNA glycosylase family protein [Reichenbachiella sp.]|uniref:uracil-DNA glycosylase family protein n=1 Tax=Reichenbachiella sp. TaxID=2184521 RepID=UPI00326787DB
MAEPENISTRILEFYQTLSAPAKLPKSVETLNPYQTDEGWDTTSRFYHKYYTDKRSRRMLFGINPGRFGGGITGVPFTDPLLLETVCDIENSFNKRAELSSRFIYEMIASYGGPEEFYNKFYITGMSPLGFVQDGKNLNYYDLADWQKIFEKDMTAWVKAQLKFNIDTSVAYSIGQGQNLKFLNRLNDEHGFFDEIVPLPHPRWVMQYRLKRKAEFIAEYLEKLG